MIYVLNLSSTGINYEVILDQLYYKLKSQISQLWIFDSIVYIHIPKDEHSKLKKKSIKYIFVGYENETKTCKIFDLSLCNMYISQDIIFDKTLIDFDYIRNYLTLTNEPKLFLETKTSSKNLMDDIHASIIDQIVPFENSNYGHNNSSNSPLFVTTSSSFLPTSRDTTSCIFQPHIESIVQRRYLIGNKKKNLT